ncbi:hypothetical protein EU94_1736 [Prochlorococcus marinus str. MIT 9123]|nr:hypothetical protein EU94_1736 [Prochlorococcus marinus str. MIT 9123]
MINLEDLPLTLDIAAGVIVLMFVLRTNFLRIGIRPSMLEL